MVIILLNVRPFYAGYMSCGTYFVQDKLLSEFGFLSFIFEKMVGYIIYSKEFLKRVQISVILLIFFC